MNSRAALARAARPTYGRSLPVLRTGIVAAALALLAGIAVQACGAYPSHRDDAPPATTVRVTVDPRLELFMTVAWLAGYAEKGLVNDLDTPYRRAVEARFAPYRDHPAVARVARLVRGEFAFDAPPTLMVHAGPLPQLELSEAVPDAIVARAGGRAEIEALLADLRAFATETRHAEFFAGQQPWFDAIAEPVRAELARLDPVVPLERWFGWRQASYTVILSPLGRGNFGPRVGAGGAWHVFNVMSPQEVRDGELRFREGLAFTRLLWHEFAHSFVNPTVEASWPAAERHSQSHERVADDMARLGYVDWYTTVIEHVVRAVTVRLVRESCGSADAETLRREELARGFAYLDALLARLVEYEHRRGLYPTFRDFYPVLLEAFADGASSPAGDRGH